MDNSIKVDEKLKEIVDRVELMRKYYSDPYERMEKDIEFRDGRQWDFGTQGGTPPEEQKEEKFTVPLVKKFINRVVNSMRMNPFGINVDGAGDVGDVIRQAIKEIESRCHAIDAYTVALENATTCGRGAIVIDTEYENDYSDKQEIVISIVTDPRSVHLDPGHQRADGSDSKYGSYSSYVDKKWAVANYGEDCCDAGFFAYLYPQWASDLSYIPQVCYQEVESKSVMRHFLHNGKWIDEDAENVDKKTIDIMKINGAIKSSRKVGKKQLHIWKIVGTKIVYECELPIPFIMLVPFYGDRMYRSGRWDWSGLIHLLRTPAVLANLYKSKEVDLAKLAPRSPWLLSVRQAKGLEDQWAMANSAASDSLLYNDVDSNGAPIPPPMRVDNTAQTGQLTASYVQCLQDMHSVTGMPPEMFGAFAGANQSGKAVLSRQQFSEIATAQYLTHASQSIEQVGRVVLALLPIIYTEDRTFTVIDDDDNAQQVTINFSQADIDWASMRVEVSSGPSYESRRKETIEALSQMFPPGDPQSPLVKDIIVNELDTPYAKAVAKRLRKTLPPGMVADGQQQPPDPQAMAALQHAQAAYQELEQIAEGVKNILINTQIELDRVKASKEDTIRIEQMRLESEERKTAVVEANKYRIAALNNVSKGVIVDPEQVANQLQLEAIQDNVLVASTANHAVADQAHAGVAQPGQIPTQPRRANLTMSPVHDAGIPSNPQGPQPGGV